MEEWIVAVTAVLVLLLACAFLPFPKLLLERIPLISVAVEEGRLCKHCCVDDLPLLHLT